MYSKAIRANAMHAASTILRRIKVTGAMLATIRIASGVLQWEIKGYVEMK